MGGGIAKEGPGRGRTLVVSREGKIVAEAGSGTGGRWGCEAAQLERRPLRRAQGPAGNGVVRLRWQEGWGGGGRQRN